MSRLLAILLLITSYCFAVTPSALVDGKVVFAKYTVGEKMAFSDAERDAYLVIDPNAVVTLVVPTEFEVVLSTSGIKFDNFSDYKDCVDNKQYVTDKLDDLKPSEAKRFKDSIDYIRTENAKK